MAASTGPCHAARTVVPCGHDSVRPPLSPRLSWRRGSIVFRAMDLRLTRTSHSARSAIAAAVLGLIAIPAAPGFAQSPAPATTQAAAAPAAQSGDAIKQREQELDAMRQ